MFGLEAENRKWEPRRIGNLWPLAQNTLQDTPLPPFADSVSGSVTSLIPVEVGGIQDSQQPASRGLGPVMGMRAHAPTRDSGGS